MDSKHASTRDHRSLAATLLVAAVIALGAAFPASAQCNRVIETFWGYYASDGTVLCSTLIFGPWFPPEVVGQRITECDGSVSEWGQRSYCYEAYGSDVTVEFEPCPGPCWDSMSSIKSNVFQKGAEVVLARWVSPAARRSADPNVPTSKMVLRRCGGQRMTGKTS